MAAKKLNLSMPHATVVGHPHFAYKQGDTYYNNEGIAVSEDGGLLPTEAGPAKSPPASSKVPVVPFEVETGDEIEDGGEIDLRNWADGLTSYPWGAVTAAIQRKFDVVVKSKKEAVELVNMRLPKVMTQVGASPSQE